MANVLPTHRLVVQHKAAWADAWADVDHLIPLTATQSAGPGVGRATFAYEYGAGILHPSTAAFAAYTPLDLDGHLVRVLRRDHRGDVALWTGVVTNPGYRPEGRDAATGAEQGRQHLAAHELSHMLDRIPISSTDALTPGGQPINLGRVPTFNRPGGTGPRLWGNRASATYGAETHYRFSPDGAVWSNQDILQHLLAVHVAPATDVPWTLTGQYSMLDDIEAVYDLQGLTVKQALDLLIDRHRGVGYRIDTDGAAVNIHVFSVLGSAVTVHGVTVPANTDVHTINLDASGYLAEPDLHIIPRQYDRIQAVGEPLLSCFTVSLASGTLEIAWTAAEATAYQTAGGGDKAARDQQRATDAYPRVYQRFRLPRDWDGTDYAGTTALVVCDLETAAIITYASARILLDSRSFEPHLPLAEAAGIADAGQHYRAPMAFLDDPADGSHYQADRRHLSDADDLDDPLPQATIKPTPGLELHLAPDGGLPHLLALNHFDPDTDPSGVEPRVDYETLVATVALRTDYRLAVIQEVTGYDDLANPRTLEIPVRGAEGWYVAPGTITGIAADGSWETHAGGTVRTDAAKLQGIVAAAWAWYGQTRAQMRLPWKALLDAYPVGQYLTTTYDGQSVGAVVTRRRWDFSDPVGSTLIEAGYVIPSVGPFVENLTGVGDRRAPARRLAELQARADALERLMGRGPRNPQGGNGDQVGLDYHLVGDYPTTWTTAVRQITWGSGLSAELSYPEPGTLKLGN